MLLCVDIMCLSNVTNIIRIYIYKEQHRSVHTFDDLSASLDGMDTWRRI